jgi:hypothetical protein
MIVVTTPTGHIGSQLVPHLLAAGAPVRVIARKPEKLSAEIQSRVEVVRGSTDDIKVLSQALRMHTPSSGWSLRHSSRRISTLICFVSRSQLVMPLRREACSALWPYRASDAVWRGVLLLLPAFAMDEMIERTGVYYRALWNPGFMENILRQVQPIKHHGMFFGPDRPDIKTPHVATRDIAASAPQNFCLMSHGQVKAVSQCWARRICHATT